MPQEGTSGQRTLLGTSLCGLSRAGAPAQEVFSGFTGTLQTDPYAGYNEVILPEKVVRVAYLARVRPKFIEVQPIAKQPSGKVLEYIGKLYALERKWVEESPDKRRMLRQQLSAPVLLELKAYPDDLQQKTLPSVPLTKALFYALVQWDDIVRIFSDGAYELDNKRVWRQVRRNHGAQES